MIKVRTWVGLDVHAAKVVACVVDAESGEMIVRRLPGLMTEVVGFCAGLPAPVRVAYEAGPTGFGLARALQAAGIWCVIAAPGKIERPAQDKIKTDRRDAERLVRLLMIDGLHAVRVPSVEEQGLRDLVRAREDVRGDLMRARHRMGKLLLRHDVRYDGAGNNWTHRHRQWLSMVRLTERAAQATLLDDLGAIDALQIRRDQLEAMISELAPVSPWAADIARLRCLRGIDTLTAVGLCAEITDFERFEHPKLLMNYVGLVPSEHSSGQTRRQGAITKSGSQHASSGPAIRGTDVCSFSARRETGRLDSNMPASPPMQGRLAGGSRWSRAAAPRRWSHAARAGLVAIAATRSGLAARCLVWVLWATERLTSTQKAGGWFCGGHRQRRETN